MRPRNGCIGARIGRHHICTRGGVRLEYRGAALPTVGDDHRRSGCSAGAADLVGHRWPARASLRGTPLLRACVVRAAGRRLRGKSERNYVVPPDCGPASREGWARDHWVGLSVGPLRAQIGSIVPQTLSQAAGPGSLREAIQASMTSSQLSAVYLMAAAAFGGCTGQISAPGESNGTEGATQGAPGGATGAQATPQAVWHRWRRARSGTARPPDERAIQ